ncbi:hypothetical protein ONZ45_g13579 [Pleurotus djamor]|nr:hypothetical protein ONZ45_g13579 [Pleurotus djamor]
MNRRAKRQRTRKATISYGSDEEEDVEDVVDREVVGSRGNVSVNATVVQVAMPTNSNAEPSQNPTCSPSNQDKDQGNKDQDEEQLPTAAESTLKEWADQYRSLYMDELLRLHGRTGVIFHSISECAKCILSRHAYLPCHRIEKWSGTHFVSVSLAELGLVVNLGHGTTGPCSAPGNLRQICLVDLSGHHTLIVQFCACKGLSEQVQLLRMHWFPASLHEPRTAFTLDTLNTFHLLTLQSKISAYDFCKFLEHKTDNVLQVKSYYDQFRYCIRIYRHLQLLLRGGVGQNPLGITSVTPGDLAVDCPACPHPDINLPDGWDQAADDKKWLYTLRLAIDANFCLKNKDRQIKNDPPLGDGWGHWVPLGPYMEHVTTHKGEAEPNLCDSELRAVDHANSRRSAGYVSTGVGGVVCARHSLVRKNGMGSLQVGERYANMDFIVLYTLKATRIQDLFLSYDIGCQWSRNLPQRITQHPTDRQLPDSLLSRTTIVIPKFHIYGHGHSCQVRYSSNFLRWCAQTDGEDPERWWAHINPVSMSTRLMGPGSRLDTIDDHAAAWNWQKIRGFGAFLSEKLRVALILSEQHTSLHNQFSLSFPNATVQSWETMVCAWEANPSRINPFDEGVVHSTLAEVRLALAKEATRSLPVAGPETSLHMFVYQGLELEEDQRVLEASIKEKTTLQAVETQEKRNALARRITAWRGLQATYMPTVPQDVTASLSPISHPERFSLQLPSHFPRSPELLSVQSIETRLRIAQADDAITEIKRLLRISAGLKDYKHTQVGYGQQPNTRMRAVIARYQMKVDMASNRYRAARRALLTLDEGGDWTPRLLELKPEHVRWPSRNPTESESRREVSWIWMNSISGNRNVDPALASSNSEMDKSLRAEWARSRARSHRWKEEVELVHEEMRRVLKYFTWKASWWKSQALLRDDLPPVLAEGVSAHAYREAGTMDTLHKAFLSQWSSQVTAAGMTLPISMYLMIEVRYLSSHKLRTFMFLEALGYSYFNVFDVTSTVSTVCSHSGVTARVLIFPCNFTFTFLVVRSNSYYFNVFDVTSMVLIVPSNCRNITSTVLTVRSNSGYFDAFHGLLLLSLLLYFGDFDGLKLLYFDGFDGSDYSDEIDVTSTKFTIYSHFTLTIFVF